jgi:acetylornithine deacetylase/succinyl-diaminopimelate desuccinylase-like protein
MTSPATLDSALAAWFEQNDQRLHDDLFAFLRIPSVSARSEHNGDTRRAAEWLHAQLARIGFATETLETPGHPIVLAEWRKAPKGAPTVLIYGHYDVQPAEPLELWTSPAFEPTIRDGNIYARGSVDDKGQLWLHVAALEAHLATRGTLPVNVIVMAEGEEEVGSEHLASFVETHRERLGCDAVVISDSTMFAPGIPSILSSLRGLAYLQVDITGPNSDLHSGMYGGAVVNPASAMARIIAGLHELDGTVAVPGFYTKVRDFPEEVREGMRELPFDEAAFKSHLGVEHLGGEVGYTTLEKLWTRPTLEINGMLSGYTGEGAKTVLPGKAMFKVSCRLVPDQDPIEIAQMVEARVRNLAPKGVTVEVTHLHGGHPWRAELDGPIYEAASRALHGAFGREPVITGEGGSIPVVNDFAKILGAPVLLIGFGLPGENAHAPDEWISQENFRKGMRAVASLWDELQKQV